MKRKEVSTHPGQYRFFGENPPVSTYIPKVIKEEIVKLVNTQNKNNGDNDMSYSKWCRLWILSHFDKDQRRKMLGDSVIADYKKEAEEKFAEEFKEKYITEGEMTVKSELLKKSISKEICPKKGCGGRIVKLSYPIQNQSDNKIDIITVTIGICEKCMTPRKLSQ